MSLFGSVMLLSSPATRGESLADLMEQVGLGALIGTWVDADTGGEMVTVTYSWKIKNHALALSVKSQNGNSEAMIALDPATEEVIHIGVDDEGRMSKGKWSSDNGLAVLEVARFSGAGADRKIRISHKIVGNKELVVGMTNASTGESGEFSLVRKAE